MEYWDVYNEDRIKTKKTLLRGDTIIKGDYHLVVHICIINDDNKMLIQQRQPFKEGHPNMWDISVGGSALQGENSKEAAKRETFEEIGLSIDLDNRRPKITVNFDHGFDDIYVVNMNVDLSKLKLQYEEVQAVKWASFQEIKTMIAEGTFIPVYEGLLQYLFESKHTYGISRL